MIELYFIAALMAGALAIVATANSLVRVIIGAEVLILAAIFAAAFARDFTTLAVAAGIGVAETLIFVATLFKLAKSGYV